ncbi:hypothetical protein APUTEX25_002887, partial [Auxenochlorella protothecoides]
VQVLVDSVVGCLPVYRDAQHLALPTVRPSALWVEAVLADRYDTLGIPVRTSYAEATFSGCTWDTTLTFATRYRDLDHTAQLALTVWEVREGVPQRALAGATLRFFSKKGRLKTGAHTLRLWTPGPADGGWPSKTPGKVPLKERGERGPTITRGDDLRQDQLVVQMISLMDTLLRREHLDLRVTRYAVLPTSSRDGLIQFVPAVPLARLLATHRSIHRYLAQAAPDATGPYGLQPGVLANFVKSCAAACVMTYILGVGDRHLDNLLLARDGRLFHIDFGFILGRDPKPFPPPMKLCREMVDALGGADSEHYRRFASHACEAFNVLRKSAGLLTGLLRLMAGSRLPDIAADPDAALLKVQEKLRLDLGDEEAARYMRQLLADSASALMPAIMETTHRWAQYW